ncbi:hypothetical protein HELRODRAFT_176321 [Helobdella robusta]|uniref:G-protein coupled receptors family 1 profile domain-containing protein n=1 Tax=Helobdella robusta TaxID=6412 RepID=T1FAE1_HELRO|nr:hypothetical protein HELRODRAFT_176321 [Helobdella robusta]ESO00018.1 hypothetical protein HELRODRAFT_176321 [Helobdella robusta]
MSGTQQTNQQPAVSIHQQQQQQQTTCERLLNRQVGTNTFRKHTSVGYTLLKLLSRKYIVIVHPLKSRTWCDSGRALKIIIGLWTLAGLLSSPLLFSQNYHYFIVKYEHFVSIYNFGVNFMVAQQVISSGLLAFC